nr:retrovirus-related Pol polyprotein from transposon TNT 1-94 [Tanacetum cinerariifolium]
LQKLVSQLELLDKKISQEDVNQKLLRSLSPEWNTHAIVWRNKADLDTMSMNDLYNNLKIVDNGKKRLGYEHYNAVPPFYIGNFKPPTPDLSLTGLDEFVNKPVVENSNAKEETKSVRKNDDALIIKEWVSNNEEENVSQPRIEMKTVRLSIVNKEIVKPRQQEKTARKTVKQAESVNTVRYVQNRVLVVKPHNKTTYELFHGRTPTLNFMRPFGCPVTILNTINHLGKFDGKVDEGFFVGYSLNSKAFRVFNSKTRIVEENLHIRLLNHHFPKIQRVLMLMDPNLQVMMERRLMKIQEKNECKDQEKEDNVNSTNNVNIVSSSVNAAGTNKDNELPFDSNKPDLEDVSMFNFLNDDEDDGPVADINNLDTTIQVSHIPTTRIHKDHPLHQVIRDLHSTTQTRNMSKNLEEHGNKKDERGIVIRNKARLVAQGHIQEEGIDYDKVFAPVVRIKTIRLFLAYALFKDFVVYQMDVKGDFLMYINHKNLKIQTFLIEYTRLKKHCMDYTNLLEHVCACARYQVNLKVSHLHAMKRIFRYLKGQPKLGLWYPKDSPLDLVAYIDSDYAGASLDWKSTTGGIINIVIIVKIAMACVFLVFGLTFCKKRHTLTTTGSKLMLPGITYYCQLKVNADRHNLLLLDGKKIIITEASIRRDLQLADEEDNVADEAVYKELGDSLVKVATTASSLEGKQDSGNINKTQSKATPNEPSSQGIDSGGGPRCQKAMGDTTAQTRFESVSEHSYNSLLARGNTLQSDEDRMKINELMELCTNLQTRVLKLEKTKTTQGNEIASLKKRVKKLKNKYRSRTHKLKRLYKIGLTARVESSDEESLGDDASKQERIEAIDQDEDITLVN